MCGDSNCDYIVMHSRCKFLVSDILESSHILETHSRGIDALHISSPSLLSSHFCTLNSELDTPICLLISHQMRGYTISNQLNLQALPVACCSSILLGQQSAAKELVPCLVDNMHGCICAKIKG